jgi:hypothetical protein
MEAYENNFGRNIPAIQELVTKTREIQANTILGIGMAVSSIIINSRKDVLNTDGYLMLEDHNEEPILMFRKDDNDQIFIEGFTEEGEPVFSEVWEYMTNTWYDCEVETLIQVMESLDRIHKKIIEAGK